MLTILVLMASGASAAIIDGTATPASWEVDSGPVTEITTVPGEWLNTGTWVGVNANGNNSGTVPQVYVYTTTINTLGFINVAIDISVLQDDQLTAVAISSGSFTNTGPALAVPYNADGFAPPGTFTLNPADNLDNQTLTLTVTDLRQSRSGLNVKILDVRSQDLPPVPEPATYGLVGLGLAALALIRRRRNA